ncbi:MAG TPA: hypothetical protein VM532_15690 [Burkholderiales bacterium]|nr:hypothetical protein [Burkholderiales bacterium]
MRVEIGDYVLDIDPERTRKTYLEIEKGGAESCGCSYCRNYLTAIPEALPEEVLQFFSKVGIDLKKDAEVYEQGEMSPGVRSYGGEYYFWGTVVAEPKKEQRLSKGFRFAFMRPSPLAQKQFQSEGALCLYFNTELPWVLENERG